MKVVQRFFCLLFIFSLLFSLCSCNGRPADAPTEPPTEVPKQIWSPYAGNLDNYVYYYEDEANRQLEEDVLYVAEVFLGEVYATGHPLLTNNSFATFFGTDDSAYERLVHYDKEKRQQFIDSINELIPMIGSLEEYRVMLELQKIVAELKDLHSYVDVTANYFYPIFLTSFYEDGNVQYCATIMPKGSERIGALYAPLVAINNVPIEEILQKLSAYISYETNYAAAEHLSSLLTCSEYLHAIGITDHKEEPAFFTFLRTDGTTVDICLSAMTAQQVSESDLLGVWETENGFLYERNTDRNYWWEYLDDQKLLYIRFNQMAEDSELRYTDFISQLMAHLESHPETQKLVIDLRNNPGGYYNQPFAPKLTAVLNRLESGTGYVLINSQTYSCAIMIASYLDQYAKNTILVGAPGGQPANFFASNRNYTTPNLAYAFSMSDSWWVNDYEDHDPALMPDVIVYQSLKDLINDTDTVMEYIYAQ